MGQTRGRTLNREGSANTPPREQKIAHTRRSIASHSWKNSFRGTTLAMATSPVLPNWLKQRDPDFYANLPRMELFQVDDEGCLFISPAINDWELLNEHGVDTVIDLDDTIDDGVPTVPNQCLYIYFPIFDEDLPDLDKLQAIGDLGARIVRAGHHVLSHCGMGFNRSALVAGVILHKLGMPGPDVVQRLRERRPGALFNDCFA